MKTEKLNINASKHKWAVILKERISLPEHINKYCNGTLNGLEFKGDHGTKHPSEGGKCMSIDPNGGDPYFNCFNCDASGDVIHFQMDYHNLDFNGACLSLANEYGISLPHSTREYSKEELEKIAVITKNSADTQAFFNEATDYYHQCALDNEEVLNYYRGRGITDASIRELKLGYAPPGNKRLYNRFKDKYTPQAMIGSGLVSTSENGNSITEYDFFRDRYIYPYWTNEPGKSNVCYMIGGRTPTTKGKGTGKYIKLPTHKKTTPLINLNVVKHVLWNQGSLAKNPKPLLVTEGIVDAILARQELTDYHVVSPVTAKINNRHIGWLSSMINKGRIRNDITICNDVELNETGKKRAYDNLIGITEEADKLRKKEEIQFIEQLRKVKPDIDKVEIADEIRKQLGDPVTPNVKIALLQKSPEVDKVDLADYLQKGMKEEAQFYIDHARTLWEFEKYIQKDPVRFFEYRNKNFSKFREPAMVVELLTEGNFYAVIGDGLYHYEKGVYRLDEECGNIKKLINSKLKKMGSSTLTNNAINYLKDIAQVKPNAVLEEQTDILNIRNGLLDIQPMFEDGLPVLLPHDPYRLSFSQISAEFDAEVDLDLTIDDFLHEVLEPDDVQELYKLIGMAMFPTTKYQKAGLLFGEGSNGKSVTLKIIRALLGDDNCSSKSLEQLESDKFAASDLYGKLACIQADIGTDYLPHNEMFKAIVSGDQIDAQRKFGHSFQFKPYATLFFSANNLPPSKDKSPAAYRRWQHFKFGRNFVEGKNADPDLDTKLTTSGPLSGLLVCAIAGWLKLRTDNGFKETEGSKNLKQEHQEQNNPVEAFCNEYLERIDDDNQIQPEQRVNAKLLPKMFKAWYKDREDKDSQLSTTRINKAVKQKFSIEKKNRTINGQTKTVWLNLTYKPDALESLNEMLSKINGNDHPNIEL